MMHSNGYFKRIAAVAISAALLLGATAPSYAMDLKQVQNESKVIVSTLTKLGGEIGKLLFVGKDVKINVINSGAIGDRYQGFKMILGESKESLSVLGAKDNQRRNLKIVYETAKAPGVLYKTMATLADGLWGKGFSDKNFLPLVKNSLLEKSGTTKDAALGDKLDTTVKYGKAKNQSGFIDISASVNTLEGKETFLVGVDQVKIKVDAAIGKKYDVVGLINGLYTGLKAIAKDKTVQVESGYNDQYGLSVKDTKTKSSLAFVKMNIKSGELGIMTEGKAGLGLFKDISNVVFKQIDPSGSVSYETVFAPAMGLLQDYERMSQVAGFKADAKLMNDLAAKYQLGNSIQIKDGVPALKVKVYLFDGWLYFKGSSMNFVIDLYN